MGKFIDYEVNSGAYNMSFDENLLNESIKNNEKQPILRLYGWSPACVSLGRNQKDNIDYDVCKELNLDVVRRITGGRALLHDKELTYSFICPIDFLQVKESVINSYKEISGALILGMDNFSVSVNFPEEKKIKTVNQYCMSVSTGADLSYKGKKLIGSAQFRKSGYVLQHGSILIDIDFNIIKKLFHENVDLNEITCMKEIKKEVNMNKLAISIKKGFEQKFNQTFN